jgi:uncharacterized membrane protein (TIGR02234 family)
VRAIRGSGRELALAVVLLAGGAAVALWAGSHVWADAAVHRPGIVTAQQLALPGTTVAGTATALSYAVLAATAVVLVTRGWLRRVAGGVAAALGALVAATTALGVSDVSGAVAAAAGGPVAFTASLAPWWVASLAGGLLAVAGGALAAWRASGWPAMGARYGVPEAERRTASNPAAAAWNALDRGEDPTL